MIAPDKADASAASCRCSRNKIACEERLMKAYREEGFPITIVRPSLTYGETLVPLVMNSWAEMSYTAVDRMLRGQKVIVPGDGSSLWGITHNTDFAKGFIGLLGHEQAIGDAFHITTDEVLTEFLNALAEGGEHLRTQAVRMVRQIQSNSGVTVLPQSRDSFLRALDLYKQRPDKNYSLTDCVSMNAMRAENITDTLTNDHGFEQEGFTVLIKQ
jgi:nucleoside-diphosphate-sugar epimerase